MITQLLIYATSAHVDSLKDDAYDYMHRRYFAFFAIGKSLSAVWCQAITFYITDCEFVP